LKNVNHILEVLLRNLSNSRSELKLFIENATHGDVRQALGYFKEFITSGYTNVDEISQNKHWTFSHHQVLKPMMIPERFFYDEKVSSIPNLFQIRDPSNGSHFTSIRLLRLINSYSGEQENSGFIDIKWIVDEMERRYYTGSESGKLTDLFLKKSLIESSNRLESYTPELDQVRLTPFGKYMLDSLSKRFVYLELIAVETGVRDSKISEIIRENAAKEVSFFQNGNFMKRLECRIDRTDAFLNYLRLQEEDEENQLGIKENGSRIIEEFIKAYNDEKQIILRSAKRKLNREKLSDSEEEFGYEL